MSRLSMEGALREAIDKDQFVLVLISQVDADRGCIVGGEATVRCTTRPRCDRPGRLHSLLEEMGLMAILASGCSIRTCDDLSRWRICQGAGGAHRGGSLGHQFGRQDCSSVSATPRCP